MGVPEELGPIWGVVPGKWKRGNAGSDACVQHLCVVLANSVIDKWQTGSQLSLGSSLSVVRII